MPRRSIYLPIPPSFTVADEVFKVVLCAKAENEMRVSTEIKISDFICGLIYQTEIHGGK
jgi:hypothetical protein